MMALRVCEGGVSSEQRRTNGTYAAAPVRTAGAATVAIADAMNLRRDNDEPISVLLFLCWFTGYRALELRPLTVGDARGCHSDKPGSENETDAGHDEQRVDDEFELSIREPLEDAQSEPRAEQGGRNESERLPVQLRRGRG